MLLAFVDNRLQAYTPTGTPGLRGLVSTMEGLTVTERDKVGLRLEKYRPFDRRGGLVQRDPALEGMPPPQTAALVSESTGAAAGEAVMG